MSTCSLSQDAAGWAGVEAALQKSQTKGPAGGCPARLRPLHADARLTVSSRGLSLGRGWGSKPTLGASSNSSHFHVPLAHWELGLRVPRIVGTELGP